MVLSEALLKYSESIKPISYLKAHTAEIIGEVAEGKSPYVITQHGEARAVVQNVQDYEQTQETLALLKILALGEEEIANGKTMPAENVFAQADKVISIARR